MFSIYFNYSKFYISLLKLPSVIVQCVGGAVVVSHIEINNNFCVWFGEEIVLVDLLGIQA